MCRPICKGQIYYGIEKNMPKYKAYSQKSRPLLIIGKRGVFYQVVPLSTRINKKENPFHYRIKVNDIPAIILTEQIFSVTENAFGTYLGSIDLNLLYTIEKSIAQNTIIDGENKILRELLIKEK